MKRTRTDILITLWHALAIVVVAGFLVYSILIGGSASLGYCEESMYYVGNHGEYTQVSQVINQISYIWEALFWIFILLTMIGYFVISGIHKIIMIIKKRRKRLE